MNRLVKEWKNGCKRLKRCEPGGIHGLGRKFLAPNEQRSSQQLRRKKSRQQRLEGWHRRGLWLKGMARGSDLNGTRAARRKAMPG
jgi:hypothetical protein